MGCTTPDLCADRDDHGGINDRGYDRVRSCDTICDAQGEKERRAAMKEFLCDSVFFGVAISILAYELGVFLKKKLKLAVFNPLLISIVAVIVFLVAFHIPYESYNEGAKYLSYLLTPATVCLAIPLYEQFELLKQNVAAIFAGLISGVLTSVICVLVLSLLFHFDHAQYVTLLPKSITTAIGMGTVSYTHLAVIPSRLMNLWRFPRKKEIHQA